MPASADSAEFERLYRTYRRWLIQYCRKRLPSHGDAEGIAQEAFARAWATTDCYQGARFQGWVATIARRLCITTFRRTAIVKQYRGLVAGPAEPLSPDAQVEQKEEARLALRALDRVPARYQRILSLHYLDGWSYQDIALAEDMSLEAVRGRMRRARTSLRQAYARLGTPGVPAVVRWCRSLRDRLAAPSLGLERLLVPWAHLARPAELAAIVVATALVVAAAPSAVVVPEEVAVPEHVAFASHDKTPGTEAAAPAPTGDRPTPTSTIPHAPVGVALPVLQPEPVEDTEGTTFEAFTPSPNYGSDGTVFAWGRPKGCSPCHAMFRSTDRGTTWQRLPAVGYVSSPLHLPPNYPADPRIFAFGAGVLSVSHDGGLSFVPVGNAVGSVVVGGTAAAVSPDFAHDGLILLGQRSVEYRDRLRAVVPAPSTLARQDYFVPRFSPGYRTDRTVFELTGSRLDRCVAGACRTVATGAGSSMAVSPRHAGTGRVAVMGFANRTVFVSATGDGDYVAATPPPIEGELTDLAYDNADRLFVAAWNLGVLTSSRGGLAVSDDDGRSWRVLGVGTPLERGVGVVQPLPDGRILAAPTLHHGGGLWCSVDDGVTWHPRCAA